MNILKTKIARIKNVRGPKIDRDFAYNAFSFFILAVFLAGGIILQLALFPETDLEYVAGTVVGTLAAGVVMAVASLWGTAILLVMLGWITALYAWPDGNFHPLLAAVSAGLLVSPAIQLVYHWDKVVILRAGHFRTVHGPGLHLLLPILDRTAEFIDTRIRATDFSAEKTLTRDTVPVHVDALTFWMIWDARRAVLEVENFLEAVVLSAQTALRDSIGKYDLTALISERDKLGKELRTILDRKTNPWGITILSVEITDIIIPGELENAMSRQAQAERERQSRIILGSAEVEIAKKFEEAARSYERNPTALQLRAMNMVYEGIRQNGSLMLLPSSALDSMNLGTALGAAALRKSGDTSGERDESRQKEHEDEEHENTGEER